MESPSTRPFRRLVTVALTTVLACGGLSLAWLVVVPTTPASATGPCGNSGVFGVNGLTVTCTYASLGADTFTVPSGDGITSISVTVVGAGGAGGISTANGPGTPVPGGSGAEVTDAAFAASAGDVEAIEVGAGGQPGSSSSGGGASSSVAAGTSEQVIAGGGGGAGEDYAGGNAGAQGATPPGCNDGGGLPGSNGIGGVAAVRHLLDGPDTTGVRRERQRGRRRQWRRCGLGRRRRRCRLGGRLRRFVLRLQRSGRRWLWRRRRWLRRRWRRRGGQHRGDGHPRQQRRHQRGQPPADQGRCRRQRLGRHLVPAPASSDQHQPPDPLGDRRTGAGPDVQHLRG